jgi:hypothetical protein
VRNKLIIWGLLVFVVLGCNAILETVPTEEQPKTEISPDEGAAPPPAPAPADQVAENPEPTPPPPPTATPTMTPTPPPPTPTPYFLKVLSMQRETSEENVPPDPPRHGLLIAFILPLLVLGIPWVMLEFMVVRYVQPKSEDVSQVLIKAGDGLFIQAAISMTARRSLTLASTRMTWTRVRELVEKQAEQEILHRAINFDTLNELERNLKHISESFMDLPIIQELSDDFGVQVMRFNIETRYPQETMDALNRKAEASAGGTAYLAYAAAAHLDPDSRECRELYRVYQETSGQVDAARNLGGGITSIAEMINRRNDRENYSDDSDV